MKTARLPSPLVLATALALLGGCGGEPTSDNPHLTGSADIVLEGGERAGPEDIVLEVAESAGPGDIVLEPGESTGSGNILLEAADGAGPGNILLEAAAGAGTGDILLQAVEDAGIAVADGGDTAVSDDGTVVPVPMTTLTVTASLGQTFSADVRVIAPGGGGLEVAELARSKTRPDGSVDLEIPADTEGPVIVEVSGNDEAEYYDEGLDARVPLREGDVIRAVLPSLPRNGHIAVTPLTELAVRYIESVHGPVTDLGRERWQDLLDVGVIEAAYERVRTELAPEVPDLLVPPSVVGSSADLAALGGTAGDLYALKLAALARVASAQADCEQPALEIMRELADDFRDGVLDGRRDALPLVLGTYDATTLAPRLREAAEQLSGDAILLREALDNIEGYVSQFLLALAATQGGGDAGEGESAPEPALPGDLLASWTGNYQGNWRTDVLEAKLYVWPFGWQRDPVTELSLKLAMDVMAFVNGNGCHWRIEPRNLSLGAIQIPFQDAFAAAAVGEERTYTLPVSLSVLDFGVAATTTMKTQGALPTWVELAYHHKGPLREIRYKGSCAFSYAL